MDISIILSIICAVAWGVQAVFLKIALKEIPLYGVLLVTMIVNCLVVVLLTGLWNPRGFSEFHTLSGSTDLCFILAGVLNYFVGRGFYYSSFRFIGVAQATSISSTYPILSAGFAILLLTERLALRQYVGVAMTLAGVYLLILKGKR